MIKEIPNGWIERTLSELSKGKGEYGIGNSACEDREGAVKYLRITDIDDNGKYVDNGAYVYDENIKSYLLNKNDMVFARTGASVGKSYLYNEKDGELAYAGFLIKFSIKDEICNPGILKYNFYSSAYEKWVKVMSSRSGQPGINAEEYSGYKLCIPQKREEQDKIVSILDCWAKAIELQENKIKKLEEKKKALMQKLLKPQGDWKDVFLGDKCKMKAGGTPSTSKDEYWGGSIPWIQSGLVQNCIVTLGDIKERITEEGLKNSAANWIEKDSVLVAITGATCANIAYLNCDATANQSVISIKSETINSQFLYYLLQNNRQELLSLQNGSAQGGLTLKYLQKFKIKIPKEEEQLRIARMLYSIENYISLNFQLLKNYKIQQQALMQKLLTGKVRVNG